MKFHASITITAGLVMAGLAVAGCSSSSSATSVGSAPTTLASMAVSPAVTATSAGISTGSPAPSPSQAPSPQAGATAACQPPDLSFALGAASGTASQKTQVVNLTNKSSSPCVLEGFPGVNLVGTAKGHQDYAWPLVRQSVGYSAVTLPPGGAGHFSVTYLPGDSGSGDMQVVKIIVTPPNDYGSGDVAWSQSVVLQDGATHPGTFISPVTAGS